MLESWTVLAASDRLVLRDPQPPDLDALLRMRSRGEWLRFDAPWDNHPGPLDPDAEEHFRSQFLENCTQIRSIPRQFALIAVPSGAPFGIVSRSPDPHDPHANMVGIDIFEDDRLNQGLGSEALRLWLEYLFTHASVEALELETWSFNPRMRRVAHKLGFTCVHIQPHARRWLDTWHDLLRYRLRRSDWLTSKASFLPREPGANISPSH